MCYSLVYNTCVCYRCTLIQCGVYLIYVYIILCLLWLYSIVLWYYMHLYSCRGLDLVLHGSTDYTIALCMYINLFMSDCLILRDCYIFICLVCYLVCVVVASAESLPNIEHLFCLIVQHYFCVLSSGIDYGYSGCVWYRVKL